MKSLKTLQKANNESRKNQKAPMVDSRYWSLLTENVKVAIIDWICCIDMELNMQQIRATKYTWFQVSGLVYVIIGSTVVSLLGIKLL